MVEKILLVSDGIIAVVADGYEIPDEQSGKVALGVTQYGVVLHVSGLEVFFPILVIEHLEQSEGTNVHLYESDPYNIVATYLGSFVLERDAIVKAKGAWDYVSSLSTDDDSTFDNE